jgi:hypothetical protein
VWLSRKGSKSFSPSTRCSGEMAGIGFGPRLCQCCISMRLGCTRVMDTPEQKGLQLAVPVVLHALPISARPWTVLCATGKACIVRNVSGLKRGAALVTTVFREIQHSYCRRYESLRTGVPLLLSTSRSKVRSQSNLDSLIMTLIPNGGWIDGKDRRTKCLLVRCHSSY